jgi:hypothetical protein
MVDVEIIVIEVVFAAACLAHFCVIVKLRERKSK